MMINKSITNAITNNPAENLALFVTTTAIPKPICIRTITKDKIERIEETISLLNSISLAPTLIFPTVTKVKNREKIRLKANIPIKTKLIIPTRVNNVIEEDVNNEVLI